MTRALAAGEKVYFQGQFAVGAQSPYTVVRALPIENDHWRRYRIKNAAENFERVAHEDQLERA